MTEYYPTRRERAILAAHAPNIARRSDADTLVELGSGNSDKTRLLLDALAGTSALRRYVPFEISLPVLTASAIMMAGAYPGVEVHGVAGGFAHVAHWDEEREWVEMRLRARDAQTVHITALDMTVDFAADEELRTEISAKFRADGVVAELATAGLETIGWWTDDVADYGMSMSVLR